MGLATGQLTLVIKETGSSIHAARCLNEHLDERGAGFLLAKSSRCVESCRVKVSAQPLHIFSNVIESDQRAEEHARADQLGNTSTRISHDIGSLRHSLDRTRRLVHAQKP